MSFGDEARPVVPHQRVAASWVLMVQAEVVVDNPFSLEAATSRAMGREG